MAKPFENDAAVMYVEHGGTQCPHCASKRIEAGNHDFLDGGSLNLYVTCLDCHEEWCEYYTLSGITNDVDQYHHKQGQ